MRRKKWIGDVLDNPARESDLDRARRIVQHVREMDLRRQNEDQVTGDVKRELMLVREDEQAIGRAFNPAISTRLLAWTVLAAAIGGAILERLLQ